MIYSTRRQTRNAGPHTDRSRPDPVKLNRLDITTISRAFPDMLRTPLSRLQILSSQKCPLWSEALQLEASDESKSERSPLLGTRTTR